MARSITKKKEEYRAARRNQYQTTRRAVDSKLDRQLKEIEGQSGRRKKIREHELDRTKYLSTYGGHMPYTKESERQGFAESEKKKRTAKAYAKSHARGKK
tara:strand:- start:2550 stop:2849 length:300 start_codon:yes stop_codon:yes gene_type:complete